MHKRTIRKNIIFYNNKYNLLRVLAIGLARDSIFWVPYEFKVQRFIKM